MKPSFSAGSVVIVSPAETEQLGVGDIITYTAADTMITHRIVGIETDGFITRGDANNTDDPQAIAPDRVVGKVIFSVPLLGYLLDFSQTRQGLLLLVIIPGLIIIVSEVRTLWKCAIELDRQREAKKREQQENSGSITNTSAS